MNIFYLDQDLNKSLTYHIDRHVSKMPLEAAQLLSTALWVDHVLGFVPRAVTKDEKAKLDAYIKTVEFDRDNPSHWYKPSHINHGSGIWTRSSQLNYLYVLEYGLGLCAEKEYRWPKNRPHKSKFVMEHMPRAMKNCLQINRTEPYMAMPVDYKEQALDVYDAYRTYYICDKVYDRSGAYMAHWTNRPTPEWWME